MLGAQGRQLLIDFFLIFLLFLLPGSTYRAWAFTLAFLLSRGDWCFKVPIKCSKSYSIVLYFGESVGRYHGHGGASILMFNMKICIKQ